MDKSTFAGIGIAVIGICAGLLLEGGRVGQVLQPTAALIVLGGTIGAVMIQFPFAVIKDSARQLVEVFVEPKEDRVLLRVDDLVSYARKARRDGIVSLDAELANIDEPFLRKSLTLAIDGTQSTELRDIMELELENRAEKDDYIPKVFEAAGGFSPTVGIIGAALGLIQVMQHLENINEVGKGIAVAFVATIYGVGFANIIFLPFAGKLKIRLRQQQLVREMTLEGVLAILEGLNPRSVESKLLSYLSEERLVEGPRSLSADRMMSR